MPMNAEQAAISVQRVISILGAKAKDGLQDYMKSVMDVCGGMDAFKFDETCKEIVRTWRSAWRPKPSEYQLVYSRLSKDRNWNAGQSTDKCPSCENTGYVVAWYSRIVNDAPPQPIEAVKPCPKCRKGALPLTKPDLQEIEREEYDRMTGKKCFRTKWADAIANAIPVPPPR